MHELSIAEDIIETVDAEARKHGAERVLRLVLCIGEYAGIEERSLAFAFEAVASETILRDAEISFVDTENRSFCEECGVFHSAQTGGERTPDMCPHCGGALTPLEATAMYIQEVELDVGPDEDDHGQEDRTGA